MAANNDPDAYYCDDDDDGGWDGGVSNPSRSSHRGDMPYGGGPPLPLPFYPPPSYYHPYPYGARNIAPSQRVCDTVYSTSFYVPPHSGPAEASSTTRDVQYSSTNSTHIELSEKSASTDSQYTYTVMVINHSKKSEFKTKKISYKKRFISLIELKQKIEDEVGLIKKDQIGYMEPGHGKKGKKKEFEDDQDLHDMYTSLKGCEILLWCYGDVGQPARPASASKSRKRVYDGESSTAPPNKRDSITKSISDVESIVKQLQSVHGESYSIEKMNAWAHLIHMGKHSSYNEPPDFPFFRGNKKKTASDHGNPDGDKQSLANQSVDSPTKRLGFRTQCIDQLTNWHRLYESGAITKEQYEQLKDTILGDIKAI